MSPEAVARELLVALRGDRSQTAWSRRLGYKSNVAYTWEAGRRWPTAAELFRVVRRNGTEPRDALRRFYGRTHPVWLERVDVATPEGVAMLLADLRATMKVADIARRAGLSAHSVYRWIAGDTQPRLPDFLRVFEAMTVRSLDLVVALGDVERMPEVQRAWRRLDLRIRGASERPWIQAIIRVFELEDYLALPAHEPGWIARRLGIPEEEEAGCLALLREAELVEWTGTHFRNLGPVAGDTRRDRALSAKIRAHWSRVAADRILGDGHFAYNVFSIRLADYERLRELQVQYFAAMRAIVAESAPCETVCVANVHLFRLDAATVQRQSGPAEPRS